MPVTVKEFVRRATDSGVLTVADIDAFRDDVPDGAGETLAERLVEADRLTAYQAQVLVEGKRRPLRLGRYELLDVLGRGGMGEVYRARHRTMDRVVALKVLRGGIAFDDEALARFQREMRAAAKLHHPNVVTAFDADEDDGVPYLVMEYVDGQDLASVLEHEGALPADLALDYVLQSARGLAYAHGQGIVHRDVKPANLLRDAEGTIRILDMGLASMDGSDGLTMTGQVVGTADTLAPEQVEDGCRGDERSDVYSLGCTLHALLTGKAMYPRSSVMATLLAHRNEPIPTLASTEAPDGLQRVFERMVAKSPDDRIQTMDGVVESLEALRRGEPVELPPLRTASPRRMPKLRGLALAALGVLVLALGVWFLGREDTSTPTRPVPDARTEARVQPTFRVSLVGPSAVQGVAFSPDGAQLASACEDGTVRIWSTETHRVAQTLEGHTRTVRGVRYLDDRRLLSWSNDRTLRVWDLDAGTSTRTLAGHRRRVRSAVVLPGERVASVSRDGTLRVWDLADGSSVAYEGHETMEETDDGTFGLLSVALSPDAARLATTGFDRTLRTWDTKTWSVTATVRSADADIGIVAFTPTGNAILYDTDVGKVRVLDATSLEERHMLPGHNGWVYALDVGPRGELLATGGEDAVVMLWALADGKRLARLPGHADTVTALAFSADGAVLASGSVDDTVKLWDLRR